MNKTILSLTALAFMGALTTVSPAIAQAGVTPTDVNCWLPANHDDPRCVAARAKRGNQNAAPTTTPSQPPTTQPRRGGNDNADTRPNRGNNNGTVDRNDRGNNNGNANRPDRGNNNGNVNRPDRNNNNNADRNNNDNNRFDRGGNNDRQFDRGGNNNDRQFDGRSNDYRSFRDFRRSFDFPRFDRPTFSVRRGATVPRRYQLRPLPFEMQFFYPQYRGYLYFLTRDGALVVVNPRTYRIVDVL